MAGGGGRELDSCPGRRNSDPRNVQACTAKAIAIDRTRYIFFLFCFSFFLFFFPLDGLGIWEMRRGRSGNHNLEYGARRHGHFSYHAALV